MEHWGSNRGRNKKIHAMGLESDSKRSDSSNREIMNYIERNLRKSTYCMTLYKNI